MTPTRRTLLAVGAALLLAGGTGVAWATPPKGPNIELTIIHATYVDGGAAIDPRLPRLPTLTGSEPFTHYNVFTLRDRKQLPLEAGKPVAYALVNGRNVAVTLGGVSQGDAGGKRYQLEAHIGEPGKAAYLKGLQVTLGANQPFYVGGQSYQGGTLFLELVVLP
jgi:hypothetical protein